MFFMSIFYGLSLSLAVMINAFLVSVYNVLKYSEIPRCPICFICLGLGMIKGTLSYIWFDGKGLVKNKECLFSIIIDLILQIFSNYSLIFQLTLGNRQNILNKSAKFLENSRSLFS